MRSAESWQCCVLALAVATPASAQFGGLKKKLKGDAVNKAVDKAVDGAAGDSAAAPTETGAAASTAACRPDREGGGRCEAGHAGNRGTLVMTPEMVGRLIAGLKAGKAEREAAKKEDTPYGRYLRASAAYEVAKAKCDAAQQTWPNRLDGR